MKLVLFHGSETWPVSAENMQRFWLFEHRFCRSISRMLWDNFVSILEVKHKVLGRKVHSLEWASNQIRLRWLGHVLRMPTQGLPRCVLFFEAANGWGTAQGGQSMTRAKCMKTLVSGLAGVDGVRLLVYGPRDLLNLRLGSISNVTQCHHRWLSCVRNLFSSVKLICLHFAVDLHYS